MKKLTVILSIFLLAITTLVIYQSYIISTKFGAPPYYDESDVLDSDFDFEDEYANWKRPEGPVKIGLQAGHWKTDEMPKEQEKIKNRGGGTSGRGLSEWEVVLSITKETKEILEKEGYIVDILPATIPEDYWADAFVSLHADGNLNPAVRGYKVASNQRDRTNNSHLLSDFLSKNYEEITGFPEDPNITRNMTRYYAFNSRRYIHAIHPMTPGVLIETGFMSNFAESTVLINEQEKPAEGIAKGIIEYIEYIQIVGKLEKNLESSLPNLL